MLSSDVEAPVRVGWALMGRKLSEIGEALPSIRTICGAAMIPERSYAKFGAHVLRKRTVGRALEIRW